MAFLKEKSNLVIAGKYEPRARYDDKNTYLPDVLNSSSVRQRGSAALPALLEIRRLFANWGNLSRKEQDELNTGRPYVGKEFISAFKGISIQDALNSDEYSIRDGSNIYLKKSYTTENGVKFTLLRDAPSKELLEASGISDTEKNVILARIDWIVKDLVNLGDNHFLIEQMPNTPTDRAGKLVEGRSDTSQMEAAFGKNSDGLPVYAFDVASGLSMGLGAAGLGFDFHVDLVGLPRGSDVPLGVLEVIAQEKNGAAIVAKPTAADVVAKIDATIAALPDLSQRALEMKLAEIRELVANP